MSEEETVTRETPRFKSTEFGLIPFTEEEEVARDAQEQAAVSEANNRLSAQNRTIRNELLAESDWTQMPDSPLTDEVKTSWATYRSSLRSLPEHENWPSLEDADWPTKPS